MARGPLLGRGQVATCMRSGIKMKRKDMVEDGQVKGLLVHPDWWEPYHPQLLPPPMRPDGLPRQRPAPDDQTETTVGTLTVAVAGTTASLTWPASSNNETMIRLYQVWRATGSEAAVLLATLDVTQNITIEDDVDGSWTQLFEYEQPYVDDTLSAATEYTYYVVTIPYYGGQAGTSNNVTVTTLASVPSLSLSGSGTSADLSWTDSDSLTGFNLYRSVNSGDFSLYQTFDASTFSYDDTGLTGGDTYEYYVVAFNGDIYSANSNTESYTPSSVSLGDFTITAGLVNFNPPEWSGYASGDDFGGPYGTVVSGGGTGCTLEYFASSTDTEEYANIQLVLEVNGDTAPPPQDLFDSISFVDQQGNTCTLGSDGTGSWANGTYDADAFSFTSGGHFNPNLSIWTWQFNGFSYANAFDDDDNYDITVS